MEQTALWRNVQGLARDVIYNRCIDITEEIFPLSKKLAQPAPRHLLTPSSAILISAVESINIHLGGVPMYHYRFHAPSTNVGKQNWPHQGIL